MHLLVTGGAGFIGSNLIRHIIDRPEIVRLVNLDALTYAGCLDNLASVSDHPKHHFERIDLRDKQAVWQALRRHEITHVIHLAAESHVDRSITGPDDFITTNIVGSFHLLEACRDLWLGNSPAPSDVANRHRFLHVSTDEVFGSADREGPFVEDARYKPSSPYSASKASTDLLARAYHHTYGLPVLISHSSNNYGPYQFPEKLIPVVIQRLVARQPVPIYGDGLHMRDWLHVRDHAEALWQVLTRGQAGQSYNISGRHECTNLDLVGLICDLIDEMRPSTDGSSRGLIRFVTDRPGHDRRYSLDTSRIRQELGWSPQHPFAQGIRETVRWYLDNQQWVDRVQRLEKAQVSVISR